MRNENHGLIDCIGISYLEGGTVIAIINKGNDDTAFLQKPDACDLTLLAVSYFAAVYLKDNLRLKVLAERIYLVSKRFFGVPTFFNYALAHGLYNLFFPDRTGINIPRKEKPDFQLFFPFLGGGGAEGTQETPGQLIY